MPDSENTDDALIAIDLVDDPVSTDAKRPEPAKTPSKRVTCIGFTFEEAQCLDDGIGQRPVKIDDLLTGPPGELDPATYRRRWSSSLRSSSSVTVSPRSTS